jgi:hypothetical protein
MENDNKIIFDQVKEYFKDAVEVVSLLGTRFLIKDCDFDTLNIYDDSVFVGRDGGYDVSLFDLKTEQYAKITKSIDPNKIIFYQVKEYFKDAVEVESLYGNSNFKIQDYDLNKMTIVIGDIFVESKCGKFSRSLLDNSGRYAKIVTTSPKIKVSFNPSKNWLEDAIWAGGSSVTPEILRELTEPKNEVTRLKVGGIYKWNDNGIKILIKVIEDNGKEIFAYGFVDNDFRKKIQSWYSQGYYNEAAYMLQETTIEKWEKALLKYKK